jgi:hypothetical protein
MGNSLIVPLRRPSPNNGTQLQDDMKTIRSLVRGGGHPLARLDLFLTDSEACLTSPKTSIVRVAQSTLELLVSLSPLQ